jgi:hypothetical protein
MTSSAITRRALLTGIGSLVVGAPAIVRISSIMPVKVVDWTALAPPANELCSVEGPWAGFCERLGYQAMDSILKAGWTPERAVRIYGGMSERQMRSRVAYAQRHGLLKVTREALRSLCYPQVRQ